MAKKEKKPRTYIEEIEHELKTARKRRKNANLSQHQMSLASTHIRQLLESLHRAQTSLSAEPAPPPPRALGQVTDEELIVMICGVIAQCPEHVLTHVQTAIDERRRGPVHLVEAEAG
jgi:hypothetical protein